MSNNTNTMPRPSAKAAPAKAAPAAPAAPAEAAPVVLKSVPMGTSLEDGASLYGAALVKSTRAKDHTLALIAFASDGSDAAFAEAARFAAAMIGEEENRSSFEPSDTVRTWTEYLVLKSGHAPYAVSTSTIRNYRNAMRILAAASIPGTDAVAFAHAKSAAPTRTSAPAAQKFGAALAATGDARKALAESVARKSTGGAESQAKADAKAAEDAKARKADPVGTALAAMLARAEGDAAASTALAAMLRKAAKLAEAQADAAAGGQAALTATSQVQSGK